MWDRLKQTDIAQARQQLELHRAETLRRHAEEIARLDADHAAIETLDRLVDAFAQNFKTALTASAVSSAKIKANEHPVSHNNSGDKPSPRAQHPEQREQRDHYRTNFGTFSRAVANPEYGW